MKVRHAIVAGIIIGVLLALGWAILTFTNAPIVLQPSGDIASSQRDLFIFASLLMALVAVPVFVLLGWISWHYRSGNRRAAYSPKWSSSVVFETIWWGIPLIIVVVLSIVTWQSSHHLDPFRPIASSSSTQRVQVVALRWKWLFIYPNQLAASVNELIIPEKTPVEFSIASDAPMNSFWIPELGGQIYAMNGMQTKLHLVASRTGIFRGMSANLSGEGFADMKFTVRAVSKQSFNSHIAQKTASGNILDMTEYAQLSEPGIMTEPKWYGLGDSTIYQSVIDKYMLPHSAQPSYTEDMDHMDHEGMH